MQIAGSGVDLPGGLVAKGHLARRKTGLEIVEEVVAQLGAKLQRVAANEFGDRAGELMGTFLPVHDDVAFSADVGEAGGSDRRKDRIGGVFLHVLGEAELRQIERGHSVAMEVRVNQAVPDRPHRGSVLRPRKLGHHRLGARARGAVIEGVSRVAGAK